IANPLGAKENNPSRRVTLRVGVAAGMKTILKMMIFPMKLRRKRLCRVKVKESVRRAGSVAG
ncbi:hypothetical protein ABH309_19165, partial [Chromobacterium piscinae]